MKEPKEKNSLCSIRYRNSDIKNIDYVFLRRRGKVELWFQIGSFSCDLSKRQNRKRKVKLLFINPKEDKKRDTSQDRWMTVQIRFEKCTVSNSHLETSISYYARILPFIIGTFFTTLAVERFLSAESSNV